MSSLEALTYWLAIPFLLVVATVVMIRQFDLFRFKRPNVVALMFLMHVLAQVVPAALLLSDPDKPAASTFFRAAVIGAILIPVGALLADAFLPATRRVRTSFFTKVPRDSPNNVQAIRVIIVLLGALCTLLFILYVRAAPAFALRALLLQNATAQEAQQFRSSSTAGNLSYLFGFAQVFLMPLLFILLLATWKMTSIGILRFWRYLLLFMIFINNGYSGAKTPVVHLFLLALFLWLILRGRRSQSPEQPRRRPGKSKALVVVALIGMIRYPLLIFSHSPLGRNNPIAVVVIDGMFERIVGRPATNAYVAFELFPAVLPHTRGADIQKLSQVMGWEEIRLSEVVAEHRFGDRDILTHAPPPSVGTFWAQGGWTGVVIGFLLAAFIMRATESTLLRQKRRSVFYDALFVIVLYGGFRFGWNYFHTIFLSEAIVPVLVSIVSWKVLCAILHPSSPITPRVPIPDPQAARVPGASLRG